MARFPFRNRSSACIHPQTYQYFFDPERVEELWEHLEARYGKSQHKPAFQTREIATTAFFLRAVDPGNPITVIRTAVCTDEDIDALHALFEFVPKPAGVPPTILAPKDQSSRGIAN